MVFGSAPCGFRLPPGPRLSILRVAWTAGLFTLLVLALPPMPAGAQAPPDGKTSAFATVSEVRTEVTADSSSLTVVGQSTVPVGSSLSVGLSFQGTELAEYWNRCYVKKGGTFECKIGPVSRRALAGDYLFLVTLDPTAQDLSLEPYYRGKKEHQRTTHLWRIGTAAQETTDRTECREHFRKILDGCEGLMKEVLDTSEQINSGKAFALKTGAGSGVDGAAFTAWGEGFRKRYHEFLEGHDAYTQSIFAHYHYIETRFTTPGLFSQIDLMCFLKLVPMCKKQRVIMPEWLFEIKTKCETIPILPGVDALLGMFRRDARRVREAVGLIETNFSLKSIALTKKDFEALLREPGGSVLKPFQPSAPPEGAADVASELPHFFETSEISRVKNLASWTYPEIPVSSVRGIYLAVFDESPPPADPKIPPSRLTLLAVDYGTPETATAEADRLRAAHDNDPSQMTFLLKKAGVVMIISYIGRDEHMAVWQFMNSHFTQAME